MLPEPADALCLKLHLRSKECGPARTTAESEWQLVPPLPCGLCHCMLDTVHQATPEESMFGASSAQEKKEKKQNKTDRRRADPAIQGNVFAPAKTVSKLVASDFYMVFGTSF